MARPTLRTHRKFLRLGAMLGMPLPHVQGHLEWMWFSAYETGKEELGDRVDVELAAGWTGEPGRFAQMAIACGFVDEDASGLCSIHDLWDHAPDYVRRRAKKEAAREESGTTISEARSRAGKLGAAAKAAASQANGQQKSDVCLGFGEMSGNGSTKNSTPAPAPAPSSLTPTFLGSIPPTLTPPPASGHVGMRHMSVGAEMLPIVLDVPLFTEAWREWHDYLRDERGKQWGPKTRRERLMAMVEWGPERAAAAIRHSISQGWDSINEDKKTKAVTMPAAREAALRAGSTNHPGWAALAEREP